jgi:hypothetical protein
VAVADLNGDNFPDLAVPDSANNNVSILMNDGGPLARPGGRRFPGALPRPRTHPGVEHTTALRNAQLADAAFHDLRPTASGGQVAGFAPALPPVESEGLGSFATQSQSPPQEEAQPLTQARSAGGLSGASKTQPRPSFLDLFFAQEGATGIDASLVADRGMFLV